MKVDFNKLDPTIQYRLKQYLKENAIHMMYGELIGTKNIIQCTYCYKIFKDIAEADKHIKEAHGDSILKFIMNSDKKITEATFDEYNVITHDNEEDISKSECYDIVYIINLTRKCNNNMLKNRRLIPYTFNVKPINLADNIEKAVITYGIEHDDIVLAKNKNGNYIIYFWADDEGGV